MTFDLDPATSAVRDRVRAAAARLGDVAAAIDATAAIPSDVRDQVREALPPAGEPLARVVALEEVAAVSGSLAACVLTGGDEVAATAAGHAGLRGVDTAALDAAAAGAEEGCGLAAVLVGLGRAAVDAAVVAMKALPPDSRPEQRYWMVADAAAELDAARLLLWRAASRAPVDTTAAAMARVQARTAALAAVEAARRVLGASGTGRDAALDRVARDVATAVLMGGGVEGDERAVAAGVLPG